MAMEGAYLYKGGTYTGFLASMSLPAGLPGLGSLWPPKVIQRHGLWPRQWQLNWPSTRSSSEVYWVDIHVMIGSPGSSPLTKRSCDKWKELQLAAQWVSAV